MTADPHREWTAAYLLGALEPDEREELEQHLATCDVCRDELAELAPLPALLGRAGPPEHHPGASSAPDAAPDATLRTAIHRIRAEQRQLVRSRARWRLGAAAALLVIGLVSAIGLARQLSTPDPPTDPIVALSADRGDVTLRPRHWGTELSVTAQGLPTTGGPLTLTVQAADGRREVAATWSPIESGRAQVTGATSIPLAQLVSVAIVDARTGTAITAADLG